MSATNPDTNKPIKPPSFLREVSFWSTWLFGTAISTVGIISFVQHVFGIQLVPAYAHGLEVYREVIHTFLGWLYLPFVYSIEWVASWFKFHLDISIPGWWKDLVAVSTVSMAANTRALFMVQRVTSSLSFLALHAAVRLLVAMTLLPLLLIPAVLYVPFYKFLEAERLGGSEQSDLDLNYSLSLLAITVAAAIFFVTNAYQL